MEHVGQHGPMHALLQCDCSSGELARSKRFPPIFFIHLREILPNESSFEFSAAQNRFHIHGVRPFAEKGDIVEGAHLHFAHGCYVTVTRIF
jgi:hypothetical protein